MKKLIAILLLSFATFSFAAESSKPELDSFINKSEFGTENLYLTILGGCYSVSFALPCNGQSHTEWYCTNYDEGTAGFNRDLAWIVNEAVDEGCN